MPLPEKCPFVLDVDRIQPERHERVDLYLPDSPDPRPAVVFVHGGPVAPERRPRDWPVYAGYGAAAAVRGAVGAVTAHRLHALGDYPQAWADVQAAVDTVRRHPGVDAGRVALWCFSGGGLMLAPWLRDAPPWLACLAATYPMLAPPEGSPVDARFRPVDAVGTPGGPPVVLTRVGRERPALAEAVEDFVAVARARGARLRVLDVPDGQHGFDFLDHTDESRDAVVRAFDAVLAFLRS